MPPRQALVAPVWTGEGTRRFGGSAESFWQRTLAYSSEEVAAFLGKQLQRAPANPSQTQLAAAGWPGGAFKRTLARKPPAPDEPTPADTAAWFEWLSERCTLVFDDFLYDGKVMHIELRRGQVFFYVIISYRKSPVLDLATARPALLNGVIVSTALMKLAKIIGKGKPARGLESDARFQQLLSAAVTLIECKEVDAHGFANLLYACGQLSITPPADWLHRYWHASASKLGEFSEQGLSNVIYASFTVSDAHGRNTRQ
jgi:hypothetical protein